MTHLPHFITRSKLSSHRSEVTYGADACNGQKRATRIAYNRAARRDERRVIAAEIFFEIMEDEADRQEDRDLAYEREYIEAMGDPDDFWRDRQVCENEEDLGSDYPDDCGECYEEEHYRAMMDAYDFDRLACERDW